MAKEGLQVFQKGPGDFVTNVDQMLDRQLTAEFSTLFPRDGVITEENALSRERFQENYSRLWCIDPLDGTDDFIHRQQDYAVMVGLLENEYPIAGWIYAPESDMTYFGGKDLGLWQAISDMAPEPIAIGEPESSGEQTVIIGIKDRQNFGAAIANKVPEIKFGFSQGSFGLKVMNVILGHAGMYVYLNGRVKIWDTVGPLALAKTAGLVCCDLDGNPISYAPNAMDLETLAHQQSIVIGWASYIESLLPRMRTAIAPMLHS
jgi:3'(2'), 5'-bisphosphate nucleotidase